MNNTYYLKERDDSAFIQLCSYPASLVAQLKNLPAGEARDKCLIPWSGKSSEEGNGNLLQYSCSPGGSAGKESACNVGDLGSIPGLGRSPREGNSYPLQYSGLENAMDCI